MYIVRLNEINCDWLFKDKRLVVSVWYLRNMRKYYIIERWCWKIGLEYEYVIILLVGYFFCWVFR